MVWSSISSRPPSYRPLDDELQEVPLVSETRPTPASSLWKQCFIVLSLVNLLQVFLLLAWLTEASHDNSPSDNLAMSCRLLTQFPSPPQMVQSNWRQIINFSHTLTGRSLRKGDGKQKTAITRCGEVSFRVRKSHFLSLSRKVVITGKTD